MRGKSGIIIAYYRKEVSDTLPESFMRRMKELLGEEYEAFEAALREPPVRGARINTLKCERGEFLKATRLDLKPLPYSDDCFILEGGDGIGTSPEHLAGEIYVQDPAAAAPAEALDIRPGQYVLDLCSAPGGKAGQVAARLAGEGFLLANEYVPKRAKICVGNFERLGIRNAMVTSLDTGKFKSFFDGAFDAVILDAPCSGEGMFRKSDEALAEWSEDNIRRCAARQRELLENAAPLVKPSGQLLYSTCTWSLEENEMVIDDFLSAHAEYRLEPVKESLAAASRDGICFAGARSTELGLTRRFYPHVSRGEGQFIALLRRADDEEKKQTILYKDASREPTKEELRAVNNFFSEALVVPPRGRIAKYGENLVFVSHGVPLLPYSVFSAGVLIGEVRKGILHPAHQFFSAYGEYFALKEHLSEGDERLAAYLAGYEIEAKETQKSGYVAVFYGTAALGGGKSSGGKIKNYYPKGLRVAR